VADEVDIAIVRRLLVVGAAVLGGAVTSTCLAADEGQHVQIIELRHTDEAIKQTYQKGRRVSLPRLFVFDGQQRLIVAEAGFHTTLDKELLDIVRRDRPLKMPVTLEMVLAETRDSHGNPVTVESLPAADLYVVDYWAEWCAPCRQLTHTLDDTLNHWADKKSVWIKIESDPRKDRAS
jgi:Thioredoxin